MLSTTDNRRKRKLKLEDPDDRIDEGRMSRFPRRSAVRPKQEPEVITIDDDDNANESANTRKSGPFAHLRGEVEALNTLQENLRDQIALWSERTQKLESLNAALQAKTDLLSEQCADMEASSATEHTALQARIDALKEQQESMTDGSTAVTTEQLDDIVKRLKDVESRCNDDRSLDHATQRSGVLAPSRFSTRLQSKREDSQANSTRIVDNGSRIPASTASRLSPSGLSVRIPAAASELGLSKEDCISTVTLSNQGLETLLKSLNPLDISQLKGLCELDDRDTSRDCVLMGDSHTFHSFKVDYVLRTGRTASYIVDHPLASDEPGDRRRLNTLKAQGVEGLRVMELVFRPLHGGDKETGAIEEWQQRVSAPRYVYDLGQLFIQRCGKERYDLHGSQYNVVVDLARPEKAVWLVMRPEFVAIPLVKKDRDSTSPFQTNRYCLNGVGVACIAQHINDLTLTLDSFSFESHAIFHKAVGSVMETGYRGQVHITYRPPSFDEMMKAIKSGWGDQDQDQD
ncbi:hypothetical protein F4780DRAFT_797550 [Xylariomycetidae sp. FL0641]|nr:hypothetical protein F4780DRAFT_797550 [Xylariomycetidae sp. FL0641]